MEGDLSRAFENHTVFFVVARDMRDAKNKVKQKKEFQTLQMHVDGILEISEIDGYKIELIPSGTDATRTHAWNYEDINN
jgi:hypothetical protein